MYNSQKTAERIKNLAKSKKIGLIQLQEACGLSKNAISQSAKSQEGMKAKNLVAIANILDCSVDYLLCISDEPNKRNLTSNQQHVVQVGNGTATVELHNGETQKLDEMDSELLNAFNLLPFAEKIKFLNEILEKQK